ncbi:hypothetical protein I4I84_11470 [Pseudonocardia sp. KRD-182]|uniref:hypothetical protein n=1 Tax=Pseudonocardia oceani TaxID=2792013 RepID=UPI001C49D85C|nr:hypothetical protein [Pseudonocardia oceani]MBW0109339.1 hypothetical protein [Pseudonocardia oceani]
MSGNAVRDRADPPAGAQAVDDAQAEALAQHGLVGAGVAHREVQEGGPTGDEQGAAGAGVLDGVGDELVDDLGRALGQRVVQ